MSEEAKPDIPFHPKWQTPFRVAVAFTAAAWCVAFYTAAWLCGAAWSKLKQGWAAGNPVPPPPAEPTPE